MKKLLFTLSALAALTLLAPAPGSAYDNIMAVVFDDPATLVDGDPLTATLTGAEPFIMYDVYLILINPTMPAILGYEYGYTLDDTGGSMVSGTTLSGAAPIDVGGAPGNHIVGTGGALACDAQYATVLTHWLILYMGGSWTMTLHGAEPNSVPGSILPQVLLTEGDVLVECGTSTSGGGTPTATACINCDEGVVVGVDHTSWDSLKSLYR